MIFNIMVLISILARFLASSASITQTTAKSQPVLRLNANDEFHIAIFSDLHYGEEEQSWGITQDVKSTRVLNDILDYEDPDFVILSMCLSVQLEEAR